MARRPKVDDEWARLGAAVRLSQIRAEIASILKAYPALRRGGSAEARSGMRPRRRFSARVRRSMSEGMRKYWAKRKASGK